MPQVQLEDEEWQRIIQVLATAPWNVANPLLVKISGQLREPRNSGGHQVAQSPPPKEARQ